MKHWTLVFLIAVSAPLAAQGTLGEAAFEVKDAVLAQGMLTLAFEEGWACPYLWNGEPAGFVFAGKGNWTASVTERFALQTLDYNTKHGSHLKAEGGTLRDAFAGIICLGTPAVAFLREGQAPPGDRFKGVLATVEAKFLDQFFTHPVAYAWAGLANGTPEFACAIDGARDLALFLHDPVWRQEETLSALKDSKFRREGKANIFYPQQLARQPLGWDRKGPKPSPLLLTALEYDLDLASLETLRARYVLTLQMRREGLRALPLALPDRRIYFSSGGARTFIDLADMSRGVAAGGVDKHWVKTLRVDAVEAGGKALRFDHFGDTLVLHLPEAARRGVPLNLTVTAGGDLYAPTPEMGSFVYLVGTDWFPSPLDGAPGVEARFKGRVATRKPLVAFASFESPVVKTEDETVVLEGTGDRAEDGHTVTVGKYFPNEKDLGSVHLTTASGVFKNKRAYDLIEGLAGGILQVYEAYLGPYPFKRLAVLEGRGVGWGMAPPVLVFASGEVFNSLKDPYTSLFSKGANERLAHEVAHQYFGHAVRPQLAEDAWMAEAMAEYMAAVFLGKAKRKAEFDYLYNFWYNRSKGETMASLTTLHDLDGEDAHVYRWDLVYCKGPVVLQAIRDKVGEKTFWTLLRSFLRSFPYKAVTTEDFIGLTEHITGEDWRPFFDRYVYGTEFPPKSPLR